MSASCASPSSDSTRELGLGLDLIGTIQGDYRIEARLGRGGMGEVFLATQLSLGRPVTLKTIRLALWNRPNDPAAWLAVAGYFGATQPNANDSDSPTESNQDWVIRAYAQVVALWLAVGDAESNRSLARDLERGWSRSRDPRIHHLAQLALAAEAVHARRARESLERLATVNATLTDLTLARLALEIAHRAETSADPVTRGQLLRLQTELRSLFSIPETVFVGPSPWG